MRQIVLDTETTGLEPQQGHRIIEIGCVELINRRLTGNTFHQYLQPDREIDAAAVEVHGITNDFLEDKPRFGDIAEDFIAYVSGAELIIHNAPFDVGFINRELSLLDGDWGKLERYCSIIDSLVLAKRAHPGQKNSLDALCKRYDIDNSQRELHGALLDAEILSDVYLAMTGGQTALMLDGLSADMDGVGEAQIRQVAPDRPGLRVVTAGERELQEHHRRLDAIEKAAGFCVWRGDVEAT
ncbi:MAG: DNA polymerase III subunit epsilon [Gammaproteobacteria bacterium]|jgi:DNA polymerase III subunit epsilon